MLTHVQPEYISTCLKINPSIFPGPGKATWFWPQNCQINVQELYVISNYDDTTTGGLNVNIHDQHGIQHDSVSSTHMCPHVNFKHIHHQTEAFACGVFLWHLHLHCTRNTPQGQTFLLHFGTLHNLHSGSFQSLSKMFSTSLLMSLFLGHNTALIM
jgi:hypothetical protein